MDTALERVRGKAATYGRNVLMANVSKATELQSTDEGEIKHVYFMLEQYLPRSKAINFGRAILTWV